MQLEPNVQALSGLFKPFALRNQNALESLLTQLTNKWVKLALSGFDHKTTALVATSTRSLPVICRTESRRFLYT